MKLMALLFLTLVMSACGQSKEEKAVCEAFDAFDACAQKEDMQAVQLCSVNALQDLNSKMGGEKLDLSTSKREQFQSVAEAYGQCISLALTEVSTIQGAGGLGTTVPITPVTTSVEKEAEALEKFKSAFKTCLSNFATKGKEILKCE